MVVYIYALRDPEAHAVRYVGLTRNIRSRVRRYRHKAHTKHLNNWIKKLQKHGSFPEMVLLQMCSAEEADEAERRWISDHRSFGCDLMNFTDGGEGACGSPMKGKVGRTKGRKLGPMSEEHKKKISDANKGRVPHANNGAHFAELNRKRTGIPLSAEHRKKCGDSLRGKKYRLSEEERRKRGDRLVEKWKDPEYRAARTAWGKELGTRFGDNRRKTVNTS